MQYSSSNTTLTRSSGISARAPISMTASPSALLTAFASVPDHRRRQGIRFALSAILALATAAILSNHLSVLAIAEWGSSQHHNL